MPRRLGGGSGVGTAAPIQGDLGLLRTQLAGCSYCGNHVVDGQDRYLGVLLPYHQRVVARPVGQTDLTIGRERGQVVLECQPAGLGATACGDHDERAPAERSRRFGLPHDGWRHCPFVTPATGPRCRRPERLFLPPGSRGEVVKGAMVPEPADPETATTTPSLPTLPGQ